VKVVNAARARGFFRLVAGTARSQAATMVLRPGQTTGGKDNRHLRQDQWLYVVSGTGLAVVEGRKVRLTPGTLLLVEAGEAHEIQGAGSAPLVTVTIYAPPAY
jgi:mannose-6-phosphate isomerase-like protein (cupin superfamily)